MQGLRSVHLVTIALALAAAVLGVACSAAATPMATATPTKAPLAATATPVPAPTSVPPTATPTLAPTPTSTKPLPTATPTTPPPIAAPPTPVTAQPQNPPKEVVVQIVAGSMARYRVREQFARVTLPNDAVGETLQVSGAVVFDASGGVQRDRSKITVNVRTLQSDDDDRDDFLREESLETDRFQQVEFVVEATPGLPWPLPNAGDVAFQLQGSMTVRNVSSPTTWEVTARFRPGGIEGQGKTSFTFDKFRMKRPSAFFLLSVENNIRLELDFIASIHSGG